MSRIGNAPIQLPAGVTMEQDNNHVTVKGPKGTLSRSLPEQITVEQSGDQLILKRPSDVPTDRAIHGLSRSLLANMVEGVSKGFERKMEIYGVGYRAQLQGPNVISMQLGFSHPVVIEGLPGVSFALETFVPTAENGYLSARVTLTGIDKESVGQTAANMRLRKKPEPYKGKGIRYQGERVRRKAGKAAKAQR